MTTYLQGRSCFAEPVALLVGAVIIGTGAHLAAGLSATGPMGWTMIAMGFACLSCLLHLRAPMTPGSVRVATGHLVTMTVLMVAIHALWLMATGADMTGHSHGAATPDRTAMGADPHTTVMIALIGVELACLVLGAAAMRGLRSTRRRILSATSPIFPKTGGTP